jgi:hypothetical protein
MKAKLLSLCAMLCLVVLTIMGTPKVAAASCSGDECGCGEDAIECVAECPPVGDPARFACVTACEHDDVHCSVCCCCEDACPTYCY